MEQSRAQQGEAADAWANRVVHRAQQADVAPHAVLTAGAGRESDVKEPHDGWNSSFAVLSKLGATRHERTVAHIAAADSSRRAAAAAALLAAGGGQRRPYAMSLGKTTIFGPAASRRGGGVGFKPAHVMYPSS